jgi:hypothetical protein
MLDIAVEFTLVENTFSAVFGSILAGVALRSLAGVVSSVLSRRGARASEGG